jgi:predicted HTH transcriptional regulator
MKHHENIPYNHQVVVDLRKKVGAGEGDRLEFKRKASDPSRIAREMVAFANTGGGFLYVGVDDNGDMPGLKHPDGESFVIRNAISNIFPALDCEETFIPISGARTVIQYEIRESTNKPHYLLTGSQVREYFVRVADKTIRASRELRQIIRRQQRKSDIQFRYGDHEKLLMQYLSENSSISLHEFVRVSGIKRFNASHKLVLLVLANVLNIIPGEKEDRYTLAF